ncbi:MAG: response regulator [Spirochaetota bacterium]
MSGKEHTDYKPDDILSPIDAAKLLGIARTTINYWIRKYGLKVSRSPGGRYKIRFSDLENFLTLHGVGSRKRIKRHEGKYVVAVVDATKASCEQYRKQLARDFQISVVKRVTDPIDELIEMRPAMIIFDPMMGGVDGFSVLRRMRAAPSLASTLVMIITNRTNEDDVVRGFDLGANDYVKKPQGEKELKARLRNLLRFIIDLR